jgi:Icc-related predicted phosphoesterase
MAFKLFFTTDVHGSDRCFRKFVNAARFYDAQVIVLGGDITGKAVVPVVRGARDTYRVAYTGRERQVPASELGTVLNEIHFNGFYPFVTTPEELADVEADPQGSARLFQRAIRESLEGWMSLAEERLKPLGVKAYISPGNDDDFVVDEVLNSSHFVINPEEKVVEIEDGVSMLTFGFSNPTPWNSPRELSEEELGRRINALAEKMPASGITIYNIHVPPLDTPIDQAPLLDDTLKPVVEGGQVRMVGVGSRSVRDLIMKYQPTVGLHGHVHEASGAIRLGKTICINPGSEYNDGVLRGALLNIDTRKQKVSYQLTMG